MVNRDTAQNPRKRPMKSACLCNRLFSEIDNRFFNVLSETVVASTVLVMAAGLAFTSSALKHTSGHSGGS
jgi:hypothetical protein